MNARGQVLIDCGHERIRADLIEDYARQYWPTELVQAFVTEGWPLWHAEPPPWCDDVWKARVPLELIPAQFQAAALGLARAVDAGR